MLSVENEIFAVRLEASRCVHFSWRVTFPAEMKIKSRRKRETATINRERAARRVDKRVCWGQANFPCRRSIDGLYTATRSHPRTVLGWFIRKTF